MGQIYRNPINPHPDIPQLDLLTLLFESEHSACQDDGKILHADAADPSNKITRSSLRDLTGCIAHGLRSRYHVGQYGPGRDVVTLVTNGQILVPAVFFGIIAAGGVYSAVSPSSTVAELVRQINIARSRLIVCGTEHRELACRAARLCGIGLDRVLVLDSSTSLKSVEEDIDAISQQQLEWERITDPDTLKNNLIIIIWSSGTTGLPKGVMISHRNLVTETFITALPGREWAMGEIQKGTFRPVEFRALAHLPASHIAGLFGSMISPFYSDGTVFWMSKYHWKEFTTYVKQHQITALFTVPSVYLRIAKSREAADAFRSIVGASTGGSAMDGRLQAAASSKLGRGTDVYVGQTWGMSESTGGITGMRPGERDETGSIGQPLPGVELRIVDEDDHDVEPGQQGELLVRSPTVMDGYFDNLEATRDAFHDGWLCTGDIGVFKNGRFYIVDRKKELIKYKGLQIAPAELENILFAHPCVKEAAVVGVPSPDDPRSEWARAPRLRITSS
ncbi:hypothetical protein MW887_005784 [Aspergillus wentii]|nr:hypothetical protein MW887_005784 [Aspergillus wentii]